MVRKSLKTLPMKRDTSESSSSVKVIIKKKALSSTKKKSSSDEEAPIITKKKVTKKPIVSSSSSEEPIITKKKVSKKKVTKRKPVVSSSSSEKEPIITKKKVTKKPVISPSSSEESPIITKKKVTKKPVISSSSSEESPIITKKKVTKKPVISSSSSEESPIITKKKVTKKPVISSSSSKESPIITKKKVAKKKPIVSFSDEEAPIITKKKVTKKPIVSSSSSEKEPIITKKKVTKKKPIVSSSSEEALTKKKVTKKPVISSSSSEEAPIITKVIEKKAVVSSLDEGKLLKTLSQNKTIFSEDEEKEKLCLAFKVLGILGKKFAEVISGNSTMSEFETYYKKTIEEVQDEKENLAFNRMKLFSLLIPTTLPEEWTDWLRRYTEITPYITTTSFNPQAKTLLFLWRGGKYFTQGDKKPLWILAVLAARGSVVPIYVHGDDIYDAPLVIQNLATWFIGINWKDKLRIIDTYSAEMNELRKSPQGYIQIETRHPAEQFWDSKNNIVVDFGDNATSSTKTHRFVTCLMSNYRPNDRHFGSLYLPLSFNWSNAVDLKKLKHFRTQHIKIICFAGSQNPPVTMDEINEWLKTKAGWGVVLIGWQWEYAETNTKLKDLTLLKEVIHFDSMVYEDLVKEVDFFVSNCGAGSVAAAFAGGCPQQCDGTKSMMGADKTANNTAITNSGVGPIWRKKDTFIEKMKEVDIKLDSYKTQAQKAKIKMENEYKHLWEFIPKLFERLSSDIKFQEEVLKEGIPDEYSLGTCAPTTK
jgi:hypothetical protein